MSAVSSQTEAAASAQSYGQGLAIVGIGGLVLSFDIPLIRMSESAFWTVLAVRGLLTGLAVLLIWQVDRIRNPRGQKLIAGWTGLLIVAIFSMAATTFVFAVFNTSAANVVFILAFNPMFAAILSWWLIGERPPLATVLAIPATLFGVLLIIGAGFETGNWTGDLSALATAFLIALALTLSRRSRTDMRYTAALGGLLPAIIALPFVAGEGLHSEAIIWLILNGGVLIPVAMICLAIGPMFVPAPVVSMAFLIETVLAPVWVWLIFGERPVDLAMAGGGVVIATLVAHSVAELRRVRGQRRRLAGQNRAD